MTFDEFLSSLTDDQLVALFDWFNDHWITDPRIKQEIVKRGLLI